MRKNFRAANLKAEFNKGLSKAEQAGIISLDSTTDRVLKLIGSQLEDLLMETNELTTLLVNSNIPSEVKLAQTLKQYIIGYLHNLTTKALYIDLGAIAANMKELELEGKDLDLLIGNICNQSNLDNLKEHEIIIGVQKAANLEEHNKSQVELLKSLLTLVAPSFIKTKEEYLADKNEVKKQAIHIATTTDQVVVGLDEVCTCPACSSRVESYKGETDSQIFHLLIDDINKVIYVDILDSLKGSEIKGNMTTQMITDYIAKGYKELNRQQFLDSGYNISKFVK